MHRFKIILLTSLLFICGCNHNDNQKNSIYDQKPTESVEIYATSAGNFGRAFMLANAFSHNASETILAINTNESVYDYKSINGAYFKSIQIENNFNKISDLVINNVNNKKENNLYLSVSHVSEGDVISDEAFNQLDSITLIPEGTSILEFPDWRINNIIAFAKKAKENGVKEIKLALWDSIDQSKLLISSAKIAKLPINGVKYDTFNFNKMRKKVKLYQTSEGLLSAAIYSGAIKPSITQGDFFTPSKQFDKNKQTLVFFGSYTWHQLTVSKTNQIEILKKLETIVDHDKFNIIFKGHPSEVSVNEWIQMNPDLTSASYFKSFPYEIWSVVGGGNHKYTYNGVSYNLFLPKAPIEIYSIFSTALYGENANKIKVILGYNKVKDENGSYILTDHQDSSAYADKTEYVRWAKWTDNSKIPFEMTYDWINKKTNTQE